MKSSRRLISMLSAVVGRRAAVRGAEMMMKPQQGAACAAMPDAAALFAHRDHGRGEGLLLSMHPGGGRA